MAAFNAAKQRSEDLTELVRGGKFPEEPAAVDSSVIEDWSSVIDRNVIMERLEISVSDLLREPTSSVDALKADGDIVIHEADMIALMGRVLQQPGMYDADDDDYNALAEEMVAAARAMKSAAREGNLEVVNRSLNLINQSCSNCHDDWR